MLAWKRICCAVDFSDTSRRALQVATDVTRLVSGDLTILYVWQMPILAIPEVAMYAPPDFWERMSRDADELLEKWRQEASAMVATQVSAVRRDGTPAEEIVRFAGDQKMDLLVLGTHGRTGFQRAMIGSVAERVVRHAPCPVLAVKPGVREQEPGAAP